MGFTLKIGELEIVGINNLKDPFSHNDTMDGHVQDVERSDAPAFGEPTDYTNTRWPSYTAWHNAVKFIGLEKLFNDKKTGLLREHPGCFQITEKHKKIIDKAHKDFYKKYPKCKPGFSKKLKDDFDNFVDDKDWPQENSYAVRLEWLKYWVDWALKNCKHPVFYNS